MKFKNLLLAGAALLAFTACSNDSLVVNEPIEGDLVLKVRTPSFRALSSRISDGPISEGAVSTPDNMQIVMLKNGYSVKNLLLSGEDMAKALGSTGLKLVKVDGGVDEVLIYANTPNEEVIKESSLKFKVGQSKETILFELQNDNFRKIQPTTFGIGSGIKNAPLVQSVKSSDFKLDESTKESKIKLYTVSASIKPDIARVEVSKEPNWDPESLKERMKDPKVNLIALDGFVVENKLNAIKLFQAGSVAFQEIADVYKKDEVAGVFEVDYDGSFANKSYAYHLFNQKITGKTKEESVRLLLAFRFTLVESVKGEDGKVTKQEKDVTKYQTLRLALAEKGDNNKVSSDILSVNGGNVYEIFLNRIDWNGDGLVDDNDVVTPETGGETVNPSDSEKELAVLVTVKPWEKVVTIPTNKVD